MRRTRQGGEIGSVVVLLVIGVIALSLLGSFYVYVKKSSQKTQEAPFNAQSNNSEMDSNKPQESKNTAESLPSQQPGPSIGASTLDSDVDLIDNKLKQLDSDSSNVDSGLNDTPIPQEP